MPAILEISKVKVLPVTFKLAVWSICLDIINWEFERFTEEILESGRLANREAFSLFLSSGTTSSIL